MMNFVQFRLLESTLKSLKMSTCVDIFSDGILFQVYGRNSRRPGDILVETRPIWSPPVEFVFIRNSRLNCLSYPGQAG